MKNKNLITRINSVDGNRYGINEDGIMNTKAKIYIPRFGGGVIYCYLLFWLSARKILSLPNK